MTYRIRPSVLAAAMPALLVLATAGWAGATTTLTVTSLNDTGSAGVCVLRDAINVADNLGGTINACSAGADSSYSIVFQPGLTGTIELGSALPNIGNSSILPESVTITGPTTTPGVTIDGQHAVAIIGVDFRAALTLRNLTIANGFDSLTSGGAIGTVGALTIDNCTFKGNQDVTSFGFALGGAIFATTASGPPIPVTITNSTFSNNEVINEAAPDVFPMGTGGGAIAGQGVNLTITNSTFSGNQAIGEGASGDAVFTFDLPINIKGSILTESGTAGNCGGTISDNGYNLSNDGSCGFSGTSKDNVSNINLDPAGLQNNGGPTQTIAIEPNSQALNFIPVASCTDQSSNPLIEDQRGFPRPDSGNASFCDAGAFELQTGRIVVEPGSERTEIARSSNPNSDQADLAFTFVDLGTPIVEDGGPIPLRCDAGNDALNGVSVALFEGTCASPATGGLILDLSPWVVHTIGATTYGTIFQMTPTVTAPETVLARIVQVEGPPTSGELSCGEWTLNIEVAGLDTPALNLGGGNPFALVVEDGDKNEGCFDVHNAVVGGQNPTPPRKVRRGSRRGRRSRD